MAEKHVDDSGSEWRPAIRPRAASRLKSIFLLSSLGKRTARNRTFLGLDEVDLGVIAEMERYFVTIHVVCWKYYTVKHGLIGRRP